MLHFEETLIDQRLPLPGVDVLSYQSVSDQFEKLSSWQRYVIPSLSLEEMRERVNSDVIVDQRPLIVFFSVVLSTCVRCHRDVRLALVRLLIAVERYFSQLYGW